MQMTRILAWLASLSLFLLPASVIAIEDADTSTFEFESYHDLVQLFDGLGYTEAAWDAGLRDVNRVYLQSMPTRWRSKHAGQVEVRFKKDLFLRVIAPLVMHANEQILEDRNRLLALDANNPGADPWLARLSERYGVAGPGEAGHPSDWIERLLERVDVVPNSLALAQAIEESGWGTSRFADVGNAMFGQWTWGQDAIKPEAQRAGKGDYGIKAFATPQDSVDGYMLNINTHRTYDDLRKRRKSIRDQGGQATGSDLAGTLVHYSERGQHYVDTLMSIMRVNRLHEIDEARFVGPVILLVPVGEGAE
jgi:uncharacterized FlgJ-related protein